MRIGLVLVELCHDHVIHYVLVFNILSNIIEIENSSHEKRQVPHMFAFVHWYKVHPRATWFHQSIIVVSQDMVVNGPAVFLPVSRIFAPCAIISDEVHFDYGVDHVPIAIILPHKFCN